MTKMIVTVIAVVLIGSIAWHWRSLHDFGGSIAAFQAKEACSCLYVHHQPEATCRDLVRLWLPTGALMVDTQQQSVTARFFGIQRSARFISAKQGCRLF